MSGVDASERLSGAAVTAAGYTFAMRYFSSIAGPKIITAQEASDLRANGVSVGLVYEDGTMTTAGGTIAGTHNAQVAVYEAGVIGCPPFAGVVIYMACDTPNPPAGTREYLLAAGPILQQYGYARGFYGDPDAGRMFLAAGMVDALWAPETWGAQASVAIVQRVRQPVYIGGVQCDVDDLLGPAAGLWAPTHSPCVAS